ncbi:hypothetical protein [Priestia filamentosa]|uniref:hypothetical protein n=1 Tax=Priestia filamentosa TaxID=1402861 RepID=UPI0016013881|nr:hypothetical protein [Priestia filamentosa]MDT3766269.1 hypothetical protein [Priestia filamentosa]
MGELIEVIKFIMEIFKGNIPGTQLYAIAGVLAIVLIGEILFELKKGISKNIFILIGERLILNVIGIVFYMSFYIFSLKFILKIWPSLVPNYDISLISWLAIISYISIILLIPISLLFSKCSTLPLKITWAALHLILIAIVISLINKLWEPNIDLHPFLLMLNTIINTVLSLIIVNYGFSKTESNKNITNAQ